MKKLLLSLAISTLAIQAQAETLNTTSAPVSYETSYESHCGGVQQKNSVTINEKTPTFSYNIKLNESNNRSSEKTIQGSLYENTIAPFGMTEQLSYISSYSLNEVVDPLDSSKISKQEIITPGKIISGLTGFIKPTLINGKVSVEVCISYTDLISLKDSYVTSNKDALIQIPETQSFSMHNTFLLTPNVAHIIKLPQKGFISISVNPQL